MAKRDASRELFKALKQEVMAVGYPTGQIAGEIFEGIRSGKVSKRAKKHDPTDGLAIGFIALMVSNLRKEIKKHPPKSDAELDKWLKQIRSQRYRMRPAMAELIKRSLAIFPHKKPGPTPGLTAEEKRSACAAIETHIRAGNTKKHAIRIVADSFNESERNMRHIWQTKGTT